MRTKTILLVALWTVPAATSFAQGWQWSTHFGGPGHDWGRIGAVDTAGNIYCFGNYGLPGPGNYSNLYIGNDTLFGQEDSYLAKYNASGDLVWLKNCVVNNGPMGIRGMTYDGIAGCLYVTGTTADTSNIADCELDSAGTVLARLDLNGACIWSKVLSGYGSTGLGLLVDPMGDLFITGSTPYSGPSSIEGQPITRGTFIGKYSSTGNQIWVKDLVAEFSTSSIARYFPYQLKYFNGSILVHGAAFQYANSGPWQVDTVVANVVVGGGHVLMSLDASNGVARWIRPLGFGYYTQNTVLRQLMDIDEVGNIHCVGGIAGDSVFFATDTVLSVPSGESTAYLLSYDQNGSFRSIHTYGNGASLNTLKMLPNGVHLIHANYFNGGGSIDICPGTFGSYLLQLDSMGACIGMIEAGQVSCLSLFVDGSGIYFGGSSTQAQQFGDFTFAEETYTSYGFRDIVLGKHDLQVGVSSMQGQGDEQLVIYANPNQGTFRVKVPNAFLHRSGLQLKVIDSAGRIVHDQTLNLQGESPRMDLFDVSPGYYLVTLGNSERTYSGHMVVE